MGPHPENLDRPFRLQHLIDEAMMNVDPARESAFKIADQLLERRRAPPRISAKDHEQSLGLLAKPAPRDFSGVLLRLSREYDPPEGGGFYQPGFSEVLLSGVRSPLRIDSRIPGTLRR